MHVMLLPIYTVTRARMYGLNVTKRHKRHRKCQSTLIALDSVGISLLLVAEVLHCLLFVQSSPLFSRMERIDSRCDVAEC